MIEYKNQSINQEIPVVKICDKCKIEVNYEQVFEFQEFYHIRINAGYESIWGDGNTISGDFCQKCLYEMIKDFVRKE